MIKIKYLDIVFENPIEVWEVPFFRGAIVQMAGKNNILFHNHEGDGYRYSYPLIQYKRIDKKPHLVCIEEGVDEIHKFFENKQEGLLLGRRSYELNVEGIFLNKFTLQMWDKDFKYYLQDWIPLNENNYLIYQNLKSDIDRKELLGKILIGNIISMAKGLGWNVDKEIKLKIDDIKSNRFIKVKDAKRQVMTITFTSNVSLPNYLGLGRNVSLGYGTVRILNK